MQLAKEAARPADVFPRCGAAVDAYSLMFLSRNRRKLADMSETDARSDTPPLSWNELCMIGQLPTGTVTLLLADVEGSTRLWETDADEMTGAVEYLDRALSDVVADHNGVRPVEQGEGDSFVVAFAPPASGPPFRRSRRDQPALRQGPLQDL